MVPCTGSNCWILLEDFSDALEWAEDRISNRISHGIVRAGPTALTPHHIIFAVVDHHKGAFDVTFWRNLLEPVAVRELAKSPEIVLKRHDVAVAPATINEIIF